MHPTSFERETNGFALRAGYPLIERLRHTVSYALRTDEVSQIALTASQVILEQRGTATTSSLAQQFDYDLRDNRIDPTEGYYVRLRQEIAGVGGDTKFLKHTLNHGYFYPIEDEWILSVLTRTGHIVGFNDDDVRIVDRFFLGGRRLRGFDPSGVGPRDARTGDALGGNVFYSVSTELGFPLGVAKDLNLRGAAFVDIGSLAKTDDDARFNIDDEGSPRVSIGTGINFRSPIGPIRLDFSKALVKEDYDRTETFRFSFGTRF